MVDSFSLLITSTYFSTSVCKVLGQGRGERKLANHCFKAIELCRWIHNLEPILLSYWLHTSMMELQSKDVHLRDAFKIIYNFICKISGCWINVASLTETILTDGLCPRERHRWGEPSFCGGTPCTEHSLILKDKYFTSGPTKWNSFQQWKN